jgi:hypothetical protein
MRSWLMPRKARKRRTFARRMNSEIRRRAFPSYRARAVRDRVDVRLTGSQEN